MELYILFVSLLVFEIEKFRLEIGLKYLNELLYSIIIISIVKVLLLYSKAKAGLSFYKSKNFETNYTSFIESSFCKRLIIEIIISFLIPNPYFKEIQIEYEYTQHREILIIQYSTNDFMTVITIFRFLFAVKYLDKLFDYNSNSSYRIIKLLGNNINFSFFIRCLFEEKALITVFAIFFTTILTFSFTIRIFEFNNPYDDFQNFYNSAWFSIITMTTVGYGDYLPITIYGRFSSFFLGVVGVMNIYLITVILSDKLALKSSEQKVLNAFHDRNNEEQLQRQIYMMFFHLIRLRKFVKRRNSIIREFIW